MTKEIKHTPGPWTLHEGNTAVNGADGHLVASCGFLPYRNKWDSEANARLITAAPDLLDAAQEALDELLLWETSGDSDTIRAIDGLRKAIAKARGE